MTHFTVNLNVKDAFYYAINCKTIHFAIKYSVMLPLNILNLVVFLRQVITKKAVIPLVLLCVYKINHVLLEDVAVFKRAFVIRKRTRSMGLPVLYKKGFI